ncbi:MAG: PorT family protein [Flavobacteriales bacterium]|nr:MAG: PorT family protein [Flavobacteriales bacterium]
MKNHTLILFLLLNTTLYSQGNLGISFGLNDDSFGSIENISSTIDNYDLDLKNATGFQFGVYTEIDLITFYIRPELNFIFSKANQGSALLTGNATEDILKHNLKSSEIQVPIIFGYNILGPLSIFGGPSFKYNLKTSSDIFNLEDIKDKYILSLLLGTRIKMRSLGIDLRYERGLNNGELKIINDNGLNIPNGNIDSTTNRFSILLSYDLPYDIFSKKKR